jgi:hypothetical protein
MKNTVRVVSAFLISLAGTSTALADDQAIKKAAEKLVKFGSAVDGMKSKGSEVAGYGYLDPEPAKCTDAVAAAEKAGATDATRLHAYGWPATLPSYSHDSSSGASVTLEAARGVCADYAVWRPAVKAAGKVQASAKILANAEGNDRLGKSVVQEGKTCVELIDALTAESRKLEVKIGDQTMNLDEGRTICQELVDRGAGAAKAKAEEAAAKRAEVEAKWKKVGMKGDRLALFVDNELNGGGFDWYAAGCERVISDPRKLAKAKKLFMWTSGSNGGTLVSKYVFKGNKYTETAREFWDEEKAQRYCK